MQLEFQKCQLNDISHLKELAQHTFVEAFQKDNDPKNFKDYVDKAFSTNQLTKELANDNSLFYFACLNKNTIGYIKLNLNEAQNEFQHSQGAELERIYLKRQFQGRGFGARMIAFAEYQAHQYRKTYLWLGVWENNPNAIRFYIDYRKDI